MNPTLKIRTPEGIAFSFALAGPVVRCLAWIVDFLVTLVAIFMLSLLGQVGGIISADISQAISVIGYFVISVGYGILFEWIWRGQTIGKRLLSLRVVDAQGARSQLRLGRLGLAVGLGRPAARGVEGRGRGFQGGVRRVEVALGDEAALHESVHPLALPRGLTRRTLRTHDVGPHGVRGGPPGLQARPGLLDRGLGRLHGHARAL